MPTLPPRPCAHPACPELVTRGRCPTHEAAYQRGKDTKTPEARAFYDSPRWRKVRAWYRKRHRLCEECLRNGRPEHATLVDHIVPVRLGGAKFADSNLQSLCDACHQRKRREERDL